MTRYLFLLLLLVTTMADAQVVTNNPFLNAPTNDYSTFITNTFTKTNYIWQAASGSADGSTWANAYTAIPTPLNLGQLYLVADGTYLRSGMYTYGVLNTSGSKMVFLKKADGLFHGSSVGWNQSTMGTTNAVFVNEWLFDNVNGTVGTITIDGTFCSDTSWTNRACFGFSFVNPGSSAMFQFKGSPGYGGGATVTNVTLEYCDIQGTGTNGNVLDRCITAFGANNDTVQYCCMHDPNNCNLLFRGCNNWVIQYCEIKRNYSTPVSHAEGISLSQCNNFTYRFNRFEDINGSGFIVYLGSGSPVAQHIDDGIYVYGNVFMYHDQNPYGYDGVSGGILSVLQDASNYEVAWDTFVYNNTIVNVSGGTANDGGVDITSTGQGGVAQSSNINVFNNLWFYCKPSAYYNVANYVTGTYHAASNTWYATPSGGGGTGDFVTSANTTNIFAGGQAGYLKGNFRLAADTTNGIVLSSPYNTDPDGNSRSATAVWDQGAFQLAVGGAPTETTVAASAIATNSATLNSTINSNGSPSTNYWQWGTTTAYGNTTPLQVMGAGSIAVSTNGSISGLIVGTLYHFQAVGYNQYGTNFGADLTFIAMTAPAVTTTAATAVNATNGTLNCTLNASGGSCTNYFQWGITTAYGNVTPLQNMGTLASGTNAPLINLLQGTTYHFQAVCYNAVGTNYGGDLSFTTGIFPAANTADATAITTAGATLNCSFIPNGYASTNYFQYGLTTAYGTSTALQAMGSGTILASTNAVISGLTPGTTYHFQDVGYNQWGTNYGVDLTFTTSINVGAPTNLSISSGPSLNGVSGF